jgi:hypothetical protein
MSLSEQIFLLETRKLGLQETLQDLGSVRGREEEKHVRAHRSDFDHLLVAGAFRISRIHRFIPHIACRRNRSPNFAFYLREKGERIKGRDDWSSQCPFCTRPLESRLRMSFFIPHAADRNYVAMSWSRQLAQF